MRKGGKVVRVEEAGSTPSWSAGDPAPGPESRAASLQRLTSGPAWRTLLELESRLVAVPGPDTVQRYRRHVRTLLARILGPAAVDNLPALSARGRFQRLYVVARIDWELAEIERRALAAHPGTELLAHLDALRGLLVDLWC